ncbi:hypothetical protein FRC06_009357 [Ceratobasidium sp. 370]|nr:hypothetical protein FRC06_009357 [Ceratobasidium sp. 370]
MGLGEGTANLVYIIGGLIGRQIPHAFNTEAQVQAAIEAVVGAILRAHSKKKGLVVTNLDPIPKDLSPIVLPSLSLASGSKPSKLVPTKLDKQKALALCSAHAMNETVMELRKHVWLTHKMITLWAKHMILSPAIVTLTHPPNHRLFDHSNRAKVKVAASSTGKKTKALKLGSSYVKDEPMSPIELPDSTDSDSIINISSDSEFDLNDSSSDVDELESDFAPPQPSELLDYLSDSPEKQPLVHLLCHLDSFFPVHEFLTYHPTFEEASVQFAHQLTRHSLEWLTMHTGVAKSSAMMLLGAAASGTQGDTPGWADLKGKGKAM